VPHISRFLRDVGAMRFHEMRRQVSR
jgi:hypothetical protein